MKPLKQEVKRELKWINIFLRDIFLVIVLGGLHWMTNFRSNVVFMITGMMLVYVCWQFSDYMIHIKLNRGLNE